MKLILLLLLIPSFIFSQEVHLSEVSREKINDSTTKKIVLLTITNNTLDNLCIRVSTRFINTNLLSDVVELARFGDDCNRYDLWITKDDVANGTFEDFPRFPLIINRKTSFVVKVSVDENARCTNNLLQFSYFFIQSGNCDDLFKKFLKGENWDSEFQKLYKLKNVSY